jgi:ATP-dependent DNA helicase RecG
MTATPIPRSIALTLFGDLSISIIDQLPPGRLPTKTHLVPHKKRSEGYEWIREQITEENAQVFWICPLIEESDKLQTKAVITEYEKLENNIFPKLSIDMLHGKLSDEEKDNKISRMKDGKTDILVSTSVIEVGMDIPDANIIVIEGAERFGLAQLHQLRGRVGRKANSKSWCFLFTSKNASPEASKRLRYFSKVNDGLKVAKFDLANRGPGEVYGTKQAGIPDLKIAKLSDTELIAKTREAARKALETKVR